MKICLVVAALCGMVMLVESTMYPAPAPAPVKYETMEMKKPAYEEKPKEYKKEETYTTTKAPEYKTKKPEYKTETKMEYGKKPEYKTEAKMEYAPKKKMYKRSVDEDNKKEADPADNKKDVTDDTTPAEDPAVTKQAKIVQQVLLKRIMSDPMIRYAFITYPALVYRRRGFYRRAENDDFSRSVHDDLDAESDMVDEDMDEIMDSPPGAGRPMRRPIIRRRPQISVSPYMKRPMVCRRICY